MASSNYSMIYLGKFAEIDRDERSFASENATSVFANKSFGGTDHPLFREQIEVTLHDDNNDGMLLNDNWAGTQEKITYTLPDGTHHSVEIDGAFTAAKTEIMQRMPDGTIRQVTGTVRIFQDAAGNAFIAPPPRTSATEAEVEAMTKYPIVGIKLPVSQNFNAKYNAVYADRYNTATFVPCFTAGTMLLTDRGECAIETLTVGDLVWTRDHGMQPVRWIGMRRVGAAEMQADPRLVPVRICAGAMGAGTPRRDLLVSPQHRMLVRSNIAQRMFGARELLVAAVKLTELPGIKRATDLSGTTYIHLLFDRHEVLMSEGAETESLYPGPQAQAALGAAAEEIYLLFPELRVRADSFPSARPLVGGHRARQMALRHLANGQPLAG